MFGYWLMLYWISAIFGVDVDILACFIREEPDTGEMVSSFGGVDGSNAYSLD